MAEEPGITRFGALLPAQGAAELMRALAFRAELNKADDGRTKQQRMATVLISERLQVERWAAEVRPSSGGNDVTTSASSASSSPVSA